MESIELRKELLSQIEAGGPDWGVDLDEVGTYKETGYEG